MQKWEYNVGQQDMDQDPSDYLQTQGKEGWELVSVVSVPVDGYFLFFFKRQLPII